MERQDAMAPIPAPSGKEWAPHYRQDVEHASDHARPMERAPAQTTSMAHLRTSSERDAHLQAMSEPIAPLTPRQRSYTIPQIGVDTSTAPGYAPSAYARQSGSGATAHGGQVATTASDGAQFWPPAGDSTAQITLYHPTPAPTPLINEFQNLAAMAEDTRRAPGTASTCQSSTTQPYSYGGSTAAIKRKNPFDAQESAPAYPRQYQQPQLGTQFGQPQDGAGYAAGYNAYADPANLQSLLTLPYVDNDAVSNGRDGMYAHSTAPSRQLSPLRAMSPLPHPPHDLGTPWYSSDFGVDQRRGQNRGFDFDGHALLRN